MDNLKVHEETLHAALAENDIAQASQLLHDATIDDVVGLVHRADAQRAAVMFRLLEKDRAAEVFELLESGVQSDIIVALADHDVVQLFAGMQPDDRAALLEEVPAKVAQRLLGSLPVADRAATSEMLGYPAHSVGRWMTPRVVRVRPEMTAEQALTHVRAQAHGVETIYTLPVVTPGRTLVGVVSLRDIMCAAQDAVVSDIMADPRYALATDRAEDVARRVVAQDWLAIPIVDSEQRLLGMLTVDDAGQILRESDDEDSARSGASEPLPRPYLATSVVRIVRSRVVWLLVLAGSALLTVQVLEMFEATLAQKVVLAAFIPLIIGTGGNTGTQAATTVTRALALGEIRSSDVLTVMFREVRVGFLLGTILGLVGLALASLAYDSQTGLVIGATLLGICTLAATVGSAMPLIARALRVDPAVFSTPFITTFCDASGLLLYFAIANAVFGL